MEFPGLKFSGVATEGKFWGQWGEKPDPTKTTLGKKGHSGCKSL
jgi:hypothetical protein